MIEWEKGQYPISLPISISIPRQVPRLPRLQLEIVRNDIAMREPDTLGQPRRPRRVHQKRQILPGINLGLAEPSRPGDIPNRSEMLDTVLGMLLIA